MKKFYLIISLIGIFFFLTSLTAQAQDSFLKGWKGSVFAGYNQSSGNTNRTISNLQININKEKDVNTYLLKGKVSYSQTEGSMDSQKWDILGRFSFNFGTENKWFNFYQVSADHDYFADIDYRITPTIGIGYHFIKTETLTWDADMGLGYRMERYRVNVDKDDEFLTAILHTLFKKRIFEKSHISQEITMYPALEGESGTIFQLETILSNPLTEKIALQIKYLINHDTKPSPGKEKTDTQMIVGLKYIF